ncbi:MAG: prephenate dehydratase domain-containing protein [Gemmatimonadota bacterium]|nr:prephenate dehydratase domain-containing protein [Gemmatimonadota bacterium]
MALPRPLRVAIQGERGAYSEEAALRLLGEPLKIVPARDSEHMFSSVARHRAHACLVPMENSLVGSLYVHYDLLLQYAFRIRGEVYLKVEHCLIAPVGTFFDEVRKVYSHPVALEQCQEFFRRHPEIEAVATYDTAGSVQMLLETRESGAAAIAGRGAASHYGARVLETGIEDDPTNYTRFFLLTLAEDGEEEGLDGIPERFDRRVVGPPKTSIVFYVENEPGSLTRALEAFSAREIDLAKIESRPVRGRPFEYLFYLDFHGEPDDSPGSEALADLRRRAGFLRVLGTYPAGRLDWVGGDAPFLPREAIFEAPPIDRRTGPADRRSSSKERRREDRADA